MVRISVINDYPEFLETMYAILDGMEGHEVTGFDGDETTFDEIIESAPELIIVDLRIAGDAMKGWDLLALARADDALRTVPLIVCSADAKTLRERADELRAVGHIWTLEKPFSIDQLTTLVDEVMSPRETVEADGGTAVRSTP